MSEPIVSRCADAEEAARRAAEVVAAALDAARTVRGAAHIALSGGSTVGRAYELLGPLLPDWRDVHLWYGDERCVPLDDDESNHRLASTRLEAPGAIWHPVPTQLGCDEAAAAYAAELAEVELDVALNGMGPDGHTASLFPSFPQVEQDGVCLAVHGSPKPPSDRVTLTLGKLNAAGRIVVLVTGAEKAPVLARVLRGPDPALPASLLARDALEVVADAAALDG
jgi:6-phosphogluconolactonase